MRRWLILSLGLVMLAVAAYALLTASRDEIDPLSRARLEQVLREADEQEVVRP